MRKNIKKIICGITMLVLFIMFFLWLYPAHTQGWVYVYVNGVQQTCAGMEIKCVKGADYEELSNVERKTAKEGCWFKFEADEKDRYTVIITPNLPDIKSKDTVQHVVEYAFGNQGTQVKYDIHINYKLENNHWYAMVEVTNKSKRKLDFIWDCWKQTQTTNLAEEGQTEIRFGP